MDAYTISQDPFWHRWIDGLVILAIGVAAGLVIAQGMMMQETTSTTTEVIRTAPYAPQVESGVKTEIAPEVNIQEI